MKVEATYSNWSGEVIGTIRKYFRTYLVVYCDGDGKIREVRSDKVKVVKEEEKNEEEHIWNRLGIIQRDILSIEKSLDERLPKKIMFDFISPTFEFETPVRRKSTKAAKKKKAMQALGIGS